MCLCVVMACFCCFVFCVPRVGGLRNQSTSLGYELAAPQGSPWGAACPKDSETNMKYPPDPKHVLHLQEDFCRLKQKHRNTDPKIGPGV